jgi:hypothetical protein
MRTIALALALSGCASMVGGGMPDDIASAYCGSVAGYQEELARVLAQRDAGELPARPRVGMSACTVLAMYGRPNSVTVVDVGGGAARVWGYRLVSGPSGRYQQVTLEAGPDGRGRVSAVVW